MENSLGRGTQRGGTRQPSTQSSSQVATNKSKLKRNTDNQRRAAGPQAPRPWLHAGVVSPETAHSPGYPCTANGGTHEELNPMGPWIFWTWKSPSYSFYTSFIFSFLFWPRAKKLEIQSSKVHELYVIFIYHNSIMFFFMNSKKFIFFLIMGGGGILL